MKAQSTAPDRRRGHELDNIFLSAGGARGVKTTRALHLVDGGQMRGHLKAASVIHQCTRCFALRAIELEPEGCPSCKALLNEVTHTTNLLPFGDVSTDKSPMPEKFIVMDSRVRAAHA